jgi:hypothetical protein
MLRLATALDYASLSGWGLFPLQHRDAFIAIAKGIRAELLDICKALGIGPPEPEHCQALLATALMLDNDFVRIMDKLNLKNKPDMWLDFADPISRILLDEEWQTISA